MGGGRGPSACGGERTRVAVLGRFVHLGRDGANVQLPRNAGAGAGRDPTGARARRLPRALVLSETIPGDAGRRLQGLERRDRRAVRIGHLLAARPRTRPTQHVPRVGSDAGAVPSDPRSGAVLAAAGIPDRPRGLSPVRGDAGETLRPTRVGVSEARRVPEPAGPGAAAPGPLGPSPSLVRDLGVSAM